MALYVGDTSLLLHGNGADGSTVFTDTTGKTVTPYGNAKISTAQNKFGGSSMYFDGAGAYASMPTSDDFNFLANNFTIECWFYETASRPYNSIIGKHTTDGGYIGSNTFIMVSEGSIVKCFVYSGGTAYLVQNTVSHSLNAWHHVAVVRSGTTLTLFVDGVSVSNVSLGALSLNFGPTNVSIASIMMGPLGNVTHSGGHYFSGYVDDLRVVKGVALYTANFTPPSTQLGLVNPIQVQIQQVDPSLHKLAKYDPSQTRPAAKLIFDDLQDRWPYGPWKTPAVQWEFKGRGVVSGTVKTFGTPNNTPMARLVRLHREPDGMFVKAVWSDPATGAYSFVGVRPDCKYFVTSFDHQHTYRAVIADNLIVTAL